MSTVMLETGKEQMRQRTLEAARAHRASWIRLGQYLFSIHKDKYFRDWGFLSFESYCMQELGLKQATASKLLKSYFFLEKEEPRIVDAQYSEEAAPKKVPNYESVNLLRLARENKQITDEDFSDLRHSVLESAKEPKEVRAQFKKILEAKEVKDPAAERRERRNAAIKRVITVLGSTRRELEAEGLIPAYLIKQIADLADKLKDQLE